MTDYPETLFLPSYSLVGRRGLLRPPDNPDLIKGIICYCTFNKRWWADSPAQAVDKIDAWSKFAGLREVSPAECAHWAREWT